MISAYSVSGSSVLVMQGPSYWLLFGLIALWKVSSSDSVLECTNSQYIRTNHITIQLYITIYTIILFAVQYSGIESLATMIAVLSSSITRIAI